MNRKILVACAVVLIGIVAFVVFGQKKGTKDDPQNNQSSTKELSVGTDICTEFPKEWVSSVLGKTIIKTEAFSTSGTYVCQYYIDENNFITLRLNNLSVENQKKGQTALGRTIATNPKIKMDHFVAIQEDGLINGVYLIINPNLFIAIDRTSAKAASEEEIVNFATKVAERIQSGENVTAAPTSAAVPAFKGEDIIKNFFTLIGEGKIEDAVGMMTPNAISSDSEKQAWGVQLNAFEKIDVKKIESSGENTYKVTLDVEMKSESASPPIPFYGYDKGENIRWVSLEKVDNVWRVAEIATGP